MGPVSVVLLIGVRGRVSGVSEGSSAREPTLSRDAPLVAFVRSSVTPLEGGNHGCHAEDLPVLVPYYWIESRMAPTRGGSRGRVPETCASVARFFHVVARSTDGLTWCFRARALSTSDTLPGRG